MDEKLCLRRRDLTGSIVLAERMPMDLCYGSDGDTGGTAGETGCSYIWSCRTRLGDDGYLLGIPGRAGDVFGALILAAGGTPPGGVANLLLELMECAP